MPKKWTASLLLLSACIVKGTVEVPDEDSAQEESAPPDTDLDDTAPPADSGEDDTAPEDSDPPPPSCAMSWDGDNHVDEGEALSLSFACDGAVPSGSLLSIDDLPDGAVLDTSHWTLSWTPGLDQGGRYTLTARSDEGGDLDVDVWVSDAFDTTGNVAVDPEKYEEEDGLPVFHFYPAADINSSYDTAGTLIYKGHTYSIEAQIRGASSYYYPQKSYTLEFSEEDKFSDKDLDWKGYEDLILQTTFDDNLYIRNLLTHRTYGALDPANPACRTFMAVVYLNGSFNGLYQIIERVNDEFFEDRGYNHHGDIFKSYSHDGNFYSTNSSGRTKSTLHDGYEKISGTPEDGESGAYDTLDDLVYWAYSSSADDFQKKLERVFTKTELFDWWILVTFGGVWDSGGKNVHLYWDPENPTDPWHVVPWDFNASWGQQWETSRVSASYWYTFTGANNLFNRMLADPVLSAEAWTRYREALSGPLAAETLVEEVEGIAAEIQPSAERSWRKWGSQYKAYSGWASTRNYYKDWTTPEEELAYTTQWIRDRWDAVDAEVAAQGY